MNKLLLTAIAALSFIPTLEAAPLPTDPMPMQRQSADVQSVQYRDLNGDGWVSRREIRRQQRGTWRLENRFERQMARRDCYRYGDCRAYDTQNRQGFYGNDWRPRYRNRDYDGPTLEFRF